MPAETGLEIRLEAALEALRPQAPGGAAPQEALEALLAGLHRHFANRPQCLLTVVGTHLWVDGVPTPTNQAVSEGFCRSLTHRGISEVLLEAEVTTRELKELMAFLNAGPSELEAMGGPLAVFRSRQAPHIQLKAREPEGRSAGRVPAPRLRGLTPADPPATPELQLKLKLEQGFLARDGASRVAFLREMAEEGFLEALFGAIEQMLKALGEPDPAGRARTLETLRALEAEPDPAPLPPAALAIIGHGLISLLAESGPGPDQKAAIAATAYVLGSLVAARAQGDLDPVLDRLLAGPARKAELSSQVLVSPLLARPLVRVYAREGRGALQSLVLPFFRWTSQYGPYALTALLAQEPDRQQRNRILDLLRELAPASLPALRAALVSGPWFLVRNCLNLLGELADLTSFNAIAGCLDHPDLRVRKAAVRAFCSTGGPWAEVALLDHLPRADRETQVEILSGLGQIRSTTAIPAICELALAGPDPVRLRALEALGAIGSHEAVPTLRACLLPRGRLFRKQPPLEQRRAAAVALAAIDTPGAWQILGLAEKREARGPMKEALQLVLAGRPEPR